MNTLLFDHLSEAARHPKRKLRRCLLTVVRRLCGACLVASIGFAEPTAPLAAASVPDFQEVYELLRTNLAGVDDLTLQRAAVEGLLAQFPGRATVLSKAGNDSNLESKNVVVTQVIEDRFAYVRLSDVSQGLPAKLDPLLKQLVSTNQLKGGVLDLRFSKGRDFAAAAGTAALLVTGQKNLLDWGVGMRRSEGENPAGSIPWVVLVNRETSGAPEALAATLRQTESALLVGGKTAGQAAIAREFPLKNGDRLQIASEPVKTGDGKTIPLGGLSPDIEVVVELDYERAHLEDPVPGGGGKGDLTAGEAKRRAGISNTSTNRGPRRRLNEADLVRMQREGKRTDQESPTPSNDLPATENGPTIRDPVLSRAVDLLKGLAVVRQTRGG